MAKPYTDLDLLFEIIGLLSDYEEQEGHTYDAERTGHRARPAADVWVTNPDGSKQRFRVTVTEV